MKKLILIVVAVVIALALSRAAHAGTFKLTAYCNCRSCCGKWADGKTASGTTPEQGRTIAVDRKVIPLGTHVLIDGVEYVAEDTGVRGNHIDVFFDSHREALNFGVKYAEVEIVESQEATEGDFDGLADTVIIREIEQ